MQKSLKMLFETQVKIAMILINITTCLGGQQLSKRGEHDTV